MKLIKRIISWITAPTLIHGVAIGIGLSILLAMVWHMSLARTILSLLIGVSILLIIGAILGHYIFKTSWSSFKKNGLSELEVSSDELTNLLTAPNSEDKVKALQTLIPKASADTRMLLSATVGLAFRFFALGRLFAVLGITVSFAIFLATYLQVERLAEQNSLIQLQSLSSHQQISVSMRNEISHVRTLESLAGELRGIYTQQISLQKKMFSDACLNSQNPLPVVLPILVERKGDAFKTEKKCLITIAEILEMRSSSLEANRLLNFQVTGSAFRLSAFSRDLTEQFMTQFSSLCNTDPQITTDVGREWAALNELENTMTSISQELNRADAEDVVYLSGPPAEVALSSFNNFSSQTSLSAVSIADLIRSITKISTSIKEYLGRQSHACRNRANSLSEYLDYVDGKYQQLLKKQIED